MTIDEAATSEIGGSVVGVVAHGIFGLRLWLLVRGGSNSVGGRAVGGIGVRGRKLLSLLKFSSPTPLTHKSRFMRIMKEVRSV